MSDAQRAAYAALDMIDGLDRLKTKDALLSVFFNQLNEFGYESALVAALPPPSNPFERGIVLNGWPEGWLSRYTTADYYRQDRVAIAARKTTEPFLWSDATAPHMGETPTRTIMGEAGEHGLVEGYVVPIYSVHGEQFGVSMSGRRPDTTRHSKRILHMISMHVQHRAQVLHGGGRGGTDKASRLSQREQDCLRWVAFGKTDDEISSLMGISRHTVSNHLRRSLAKLDAVTRAQAVAKAMVTKQILL